MLDEATAQLREHGAAADFVRVQVPPLPFNDACLGALVAVGFLPFVDVEALLREVARALRPRGRFVASAWSPGLVAGALQRRAGLRHLDEARLQALAEAAGLVHFERVRVGPSLLFKVERP